ncbi:ABC transporter ATP-binding protein [candidate division TA06 bacterium]|uniref:ABC transporter ATP-binding protein n=1 Tax=candidate division TA06 bacterium TaxID=2250710 RepID=A0A523XH96_UNCT6|nr:MAG: ABC transporter ATP-binding protein [candidate division TA06 bacterium]
MVIEALDIHKSFRNKYEDLHVLRGVSFTAGEGEILSIVGPSGSGKSTLLHILGSLDRPDKGRVRLGSTELFDHSDGDLARFRNENIGFIFQFHHLLPEFSALENAMMPLIIRGMDTRIAVAKARKALRDVGLIDRERHRPNELSGGERQRVAVARALINEPKLVLADEPSGNLDSESSEMLHALIRSLSRDNGLTFVIVTHNLSFAQSADRVLKLVGGKTEEGE